MRILAGVSGKHLLCFKRVLLGLEKEAKCLEEVLSKSLFWVKGGMKKLTRMWKRVRWKRKQSYCPVVWGVI